MPSPHPQNTCRTVGQTPMNSRAPCRGCRAGPVFTAGTKTTLLLLKPRFNYWPDSPPQYPGIGLPREAEECDPPVVRTHLPVPLLVKGDYHPGLPVQRHCPQSPRNVEEASAAAAPQHPET
ncbi:hypothetical protein AMECASPLE_028794 [Ameca splendens]|uniref:Uncharacterized protein n=1 Tax=Ameca splendens TaxID=208324 RepID=A0ABV0Z4D4_9TELE